jgi:AhpD family alkylhydroperoxidase
VSTPPRVAPGGLRETGPVPWVAEKVAARVSGTRTMHLFSTLGRHPGLFLGWLMFAGRLMPRGKLSRRLTELVILRVAELRGCEYERSHHVKLGRSVGIGDAELAAMATGADAPGWTEREALVLRAVDELHASQDITDETWSGLRAHFDEKRLIELVMLVAHYEMLATTIGTLRIRTDAPR